MTFRRERRPELMDRPDADEIALRGGLDDLRAVNRWLGGRRTAVRLVLALAGRIPDRPVRVLDVATGAADIPLAVARAGRERGPWIQVTGLDAQPTTVAYAESATADDPDVGIVLGDALDLPFPADEFDVAMCNTALHHFDAGAARRVIAEMDRVAKYGVVVTDLARSRAAFAGAKLLAATVWRRHPVTRHDGPVSVRAAFTPGELRGLAVEAIPGSDPRVRAEPIFRLSMVVDRTGVAAGRARSGRRR